MLLSFQVQDILSVPFGYVMDLLYRVTQNYGLATILFAVCVCLLMHPLNVRKAVSAHKRNRLEPNVQAIRAMYPKDIEMQNRMMERMYEKEKVSLSGGCLLSIIPFFILIPLFCVVYSPIRYMLHENSDTAQALFNHIYELNPELFDNCGGYWELTAAKYIPQFADSIREKFPEIREATLNGLNFNFLGLDLASVPQLNFAKWDAANWANIGLFALPIVAVLAQMGPAMYNGIKTIIMILKSKKGDTMPSATKFNFVLPLLALLLLVVGYKTPAAISLYWITKSVINHLLNIHIRKKVAAVPPISISLDELANECTIHEDTGMTEFAE
jgi:YidC/Oxa1 family membrane protein insertase